MSPRAFIIEKKTSKGKSFHVRFKPRGATTHRQARAALEQVGTLHSAPADVVNVTQAQEWINQLAGRYAPATTRKYLEPVRSALDVLDRNPVGSAKRAVTGAHVPRVGASWVPRDNAHCPSCGAPIPPRRSWCPQCGEPLGGGA